MEDIALKALFVPFADQLLTAPRNADVAFLNARNGGALQQFCLARPGLKLVAEQGLRPFADELIQAGTHSTPTLEGRFPLVLVLPPRQRAQARGLLARAMAMASVDGVIVVSVPNNEGARAIQSDLERLAGRVYCISKHKCRVFWAQLAHATPDSKLSAEWLAADAPQTIEDGRFLSRPGVFAWDRIDAASSLLVANLPTDLSGHGADLGAGYGYLSAEVLTRWPGVSAMDLYEADTRALELARVNLARVIAHAQDRRPTAEFYWHDVATGLPRRYDFIITNPPFHVGRFDVPELGRAFVRAAAAALQPGGRLFMVANRHLPYEHTLAGHFEQVRVLADAQGFKVITAQLAGA